MGPARGGLVDVNREKGGPSHLRGFGFFLKWSGHLGEGWSEGRELQ